MADVVVLPYENYPRFLDDSIQWCDDMLTAIERWHTYTPSVEEVAVFRDRLTVLQTRMELL